MQIKLSQLHAHLYKTLAPLYVLHGEELLLQLEAADAIRVAARECSVTEREVFVVEAGFNWQQLLASNQNLSLFGGRTFIDLRIVSGKPGVEGARVLEEYANTLNPDNITLVTLPKLDRTTLNSVWFTALEKRGIVIATPSLERGDLAGWINERLTKQNQRADAPTLQFIADRTEGNLLAAKQEVEKLGLLLPTGALSHEAVMDAVLNVARFDISQLSEAYLRGDAVRFCRVLAGLQAEGESVQFILWQLTEDLHALHSISKAIDEGAEINQAMRDARVWGKRQQAMEQAGRRLKVTAIEELLLAAARLEALSKGLGKGAVWDEIHALGLALAGSPLFDTSLLSEGTFQ